jgi:pimeloyl-ACP methyl ester carboxylesterase
MQTLKLNDHQCTIRYHDMPGTGVPLLFIHGLGCSASCDYPAIADHPSLANRRRILVDLLGYGFSDRPEDFGYRTTDHARILITLINELGLETLDVYGHSMGGSIAIEVAQQLQQRVRHLVLSEPNLDGGGGEFSKVIAAIDEATYRASGHQTVIEKATPFDNGTWSASMRVAASYAVHRSASSLVHGVTPSWRERLYQLPMPKVVIFGELSLPHPDFEGLPKNGVQTALLKDAGHAMAWEQPAGLAELIARYSAA